MKTKFLQLNLLIIFCIISGLNAQSLKDFDGNNYKSVIINTQTWMAENLNASHFLNGDAIPEAKNSAEWELAGVSQQPAWCYYNFDSVNNHGYGKLYNYYAITDPRGLALRGWHIPSNSDWTTLVSFLGGVHSAGMKIKNTEGWSANGNGNNKSGFAALPGGQCTAKGKFSDMGNKACWWTSSGEIGGGESVYTFSTIGNSMEVMYALQPMEPGLSVRLIKDKE